MAKRRKLSAAKRLEQQRNRTKYLKRRAIELKYIENGLIKPDSSQPKPGTKAFERLRKQWYGKLAASEAKKPESKRFVDIEWADNPDSRHVKMPASRGRKLIPGKQLYYAMGRNYLTHHKFKTGMERCAWRMHIDGLSYRSIHNHLKANYGLTKSIYWLFYYVKSTAAKCKKFNTKHAEGLLNQANADAYASDTLIGDFQLGSAIDHDTDDYGIPIDPGFWESVPKPK